MQQTKPASAATLNIDLQEKFIAQRSTHELMEYSVICHYNYTYTLSMMLKQFYNSQYKRLYSIKKAVDDKAPII